MSCAAKALWHLGRSEMGVGEFVLFLKKIYLVKWMPYWNIGRWDEIKCSSIAPIVSKKEYYPYEIHLFSENRLLHVVILLDTISGCSSDFIHRSIEKCPPFRLRMMSKATACPVAHWRTAPTTRCLAHIFAICRKKHRSKKIRLGASWTLQLWLQWLDTVPYLKVESYIILLFDVEHLDFHMKLKSWKKLMVGWMTLEVGIYIYILKSLPSSILRTFRFRASNLANLPGVCLHWRQRCEWRGWIFVGETQQMVEQNALKQASKPYKRLGKCNNRNPWEDWCHLRSMLTITVAPGTSNYFLEALMGLFSDGFPVVLTGTFMAWRVWLWDWFVECMVRKSEVQDLQDGQKRQ